MPLGTTPLCRNDVIRLLQTATCYDNRNPSEGMVAAWHDSAQRGRWTFAEAADAIKTHYLHSTDFVMPGHVTVIIRGARQDAAMRQSVTQSSRNVLDGSGLPVGDDPYHGARNSSELEQLHADANGVACPFCKAEIGERCKNTFSGNASKVPHPRRLLAAGIVKSTVPKPPKANLK